MPAARDNRSPDVRLAKLVQAAEDMGKVVSKVRVARDGSIELTFGNRETADTPDLIDWRR